MCNHDISIRFVITDKHSGEKLEDPDYQQWQFLIEIHAFSNAA